MKNNFFLSIILVFILTLPVVSEEIIQGYGIDYNKKDTYLLAQNKFALTNVKSAHDDFFSIINNSSSKDFALLHDAILLAEYGFFDLTDSIFSKLDDYEISQNYINDIKSYYYPAQRMQENEILPLAEAYANIMYNNYAQETVLYIINSGMLKSPNDYTYYILALGCYESKDFEQADNYISLAQSKNPTNINYKVLKTKILLEKNKNKQALKLLEEIKKQQLDIEELNKKVDALEQFVLYKTLKNDKIKDYHLGYYYYLEGKTGFAQKVLLNAISKNKKLNGEIYALLALIYFDTSNSQAEEYAIKSIKTGGDSFNACYVLGQVRNSENNIKQALKSLRKACSYEGKLALAEIKIAEINQKSGKIKQAQKMWKNIIKKYPNSAICYYYLALNYPQNRESLLKKSLSFNVRFTPAYSALGSLYINRENFNLAKKYLDNIYYIDENDFRYYYYLSQLELQKGNNELSNKYLNECERVQPQYRDILDREEEIEK